MDLFFFNSLKDLYKQTFLHHLPFVCGQLLHYYSVQELSLFLVRKFCKFQQILQILANVKASIPLCLNKCPYYQLILVSPFLQKSSLEINLSEPIKIISQHPSTGNLGCIMVLHSLSFPFRNAENLSLHYLDTSGISIQNKQLFCWKRNLTEKFSSQ